MKRRSNSKNMQRAVLLLKNVLEKKANKIPEIVGSVGRYNESGQKEIVVPGQPDFIWVQLRGQVSEVVKAFNDTVGLNFGMPVKLIREPDNPRYYRVIGRDIGKYQDWGGPAYGIVAHGDSHSFADAEAAGRDVVFIYRRQMVQPMLCHPQSTPDMTVYVEPDYYFWAGEFRYFEGGSSADLTSQLPSTGSGVFVLIYLDGGTGTVQFLTGDEFSLIYPPDPLADAIPEISPSIGIPLAAVYLTSTTTSINWGSILDIRIMLFTGSGSIPFAHGLDPVHGYHTGSLDAGDVVVADPSGVFTSSNLEDVLYELYNSSGAGSATVTRVWWGT